MADISKCAGTGCPKKDTCYRYTAKPGMWQSYEGFWKDKRVPFGKCPRYWPDEAEWKRISENARTT